MKKSLIIFMLILSALILSGCKTVPQEVKTAELLRTNQSWDGALLPDYPEGEPELVVMRYEFPAGQKLGWHHHPVMNYGIVQQGELTIIGLDGKEKVVHEGEAVVEMVGPIFSRMKLISPVIFTAEVYLLQRSVCIHPKIAYLS